MALTMASKTKLINKCAPPNNIYVGNVEGYTNKSKLYETTQNYEYDGLYQLTGVEGVTKNWHTEGLIDYTAMYSQQYKFDEEGLGNMAFKTSSTANTSGRKLGDILDYHLDYKYEEGFVRSIGEFLKENI